MAVAYPISNGTFINLAAFNADEDRYRSTYDGKWVRDATREEMMSHFVGWDKELTVLMEVFASLA